MTPPSFRLFVYLCLLMSHQEPVSPLHFFWTPLLLTSFPRVLTLPQVLLFSIFYLTCSGTCMTPYDSFFTVLYSAPVHSLSSFILLPSTPFCACASLPFLFFYLSILDSFLPAPYSSFTAPYSYFTSIFYSVRVPCMTWL